MVYPDTRCWDSGGLIDPENYKTNNGIVHRALKSMLERVTRESDNPTNQEIAESYASAAEISADTAENKLSSAQ